MSTRESSDDQTSKAQGDAEILRVAHERFRMTEEAESDFRRKALDDLKFSIGEQWDERDKAGRAEDGRPCLVVNKLQAHLHQLVNDQRQNRPAIKISPVDDKADVETAKIRQGLIRHIEYASDADTAYSTAFDSAGRCGVGYWRVVTQFADALSFRLEARIKRIADRFSVYLDPAASEPDGSDANWGMIIEDLTKDEYEAQFPNSKLASRDWESLGSQSPEWVKKDGARVCEYFYKEFEKTTICLLSTGEIVRKDQLPKAPGALPPGITIKKERETLVPVIKWVKLNAIEVLEKTTWPGSGKYIPIVRVIGEEVVINGVKHISGLIRSAKDPQKMYNYMVSAEAEAIGLAPRAPFIGVEGQFENNEHLWRTANRKNHAYLPYKAVALNGTLAPPPQRNAFEPATQAITNSRMMSSDDLKSVTGYHDAAIGAQSNEISGVAIRSRVNQAQLSNLHLVDNLSKSIRYTGRILNDIIPYVYDVAQTARIIGEDGTEEVVRINEEFERHGQMVRYDLGRGEYDVTVSSGPSYETKRQEAVATILDLARSYPNIMQIAGDKLVANMDIPAAKEIAERMKKALQPGLDDDKGDQKIPPQAQAQMQQMNQMIEQLTQQLNHRTQQVEQKTLELESKERIEFAKIQANIEIELAKMGSQESQFLLQQQIAQINQRLSLLDIDEPIDGQEEQENSGAGLSGAVMPPIEQQPTGGFQPPGQSPEGDMQ